VISFTRESNVLEDLASEPCPAADALQKLRIVQDGFRSAPEAEKFNEDFYLARGIIGPRKPEQWSTISDRRGRMMISVELLRSCPGLAFRDEGVDPPIRRSWSGRTAPGASRMSAVTRPVCLSSRSPSRRF
jgi:hypothetical protein